MEKKQLVKGERRFSVNILASSALRLRAARLLSTLFVSSCVGIYVKHEFYIFYKFLLLFAYISVLLTRSLSLSLTSQTTPRQTDCENIFATARDGRVKFSRQKGFQ
jgi:hypothetical protein